MAHSRDDSAWMGKRRQSLWSALAGRHHLRAVRHHRRRGGRPQPPGAGEKALLDTRNRDGDVTEIVSPLVDIRSRLVNRGNVELFTVKADTPRYLALTSLGQFDGTRWTTLAGRHPRCRWSPGAAVARQLEIVLQTDHHQQARRRSSRRQPARPRAASVAGRSTLLWADDSPRRSVVDGGLKPGYSYQVTSADN